MIMKTDKKDTVSSCLPEKCDFMCILANSTLSDLLERLFSREVTMKELRTLDAKKDQLEKLCIAEGQRNVGDVLMTLDRGKKESTGFERYQSQLGAFCRQMKSLDIQIESKFACL